ncbi:MAG: hypothetical protein V4582_24595 [Pseudomonadota bacterium]
MRRFLAILQADLRERVRSSQFWLVIAATVGFTWLCFPQADAHYVVLGINSNHRGAYSSAWIGMVLAMLSIWSSLIGFYLIRGNLRRDFDSRVWELLEVTPLSRRSYLLAKWCSHMLVLGMVLAAQLGVGVVAQLIRAEDSQLDLAQLIVPSLVLGLPSLALTASCAIWFDMVPALRRSVGNYVYFALWLAILLVTVKAMAPGVGEHGAMSDPRGLTIFNQAVHERLDAKLDMPLKMCVGCIFPTKQVVLFDWPAWRIGVAELGGRAAWLLAALAAVLFSAPLLDRFAVHGRALEQSAAGLGRARRTPILNWVIRPLQRSQFGTLLAAELSLTLRGRNPWWWGGVWCAGAAQLFLPTRFAAMAVIGAWLLLIDIYAGAALRESVARATPVVFSAPHALRRVFAARWLMLFILGVALYLPAMLRFAVLAPSVAVAILALALSLPSWAMAVAAFTRTARGAELGMCVLAYLGFQGMAVSNVTAAPVWTASMHMALLPVAAVLLWVGWTRLHRAIV